MEGVREEKLERLSSRLDPVLEPGERIIFITDYTIFGKGKDFFIVTDRACRFFERKKINILKY